MLAPRSLWTALAGEDDREHDRRVQVVDGPALLTAEVGYAFSGSLADLHDKKSA